MGKISRTRDISLRVAVVSAWLFVLGSMLTLAVTAWFMWPGSGSVAEIMGADTAEGDTVAFPGFRYVGSPGLAFMLFQLALVTTGVVLSVVPWHQPRKVGHTVLVLWAAWWLAAAMYAWRWEGGFLLGAMVLLIGFLFACTITRAAVGVRRHAAEPQPETKPETKPEAEITEEEDEIDEPLPVADAAG